MMVPLTENEQIVFDWLNRKYVQRADDRQKSMGLQYTTAETHDLAREFYRFYEQQRALETSVEDEMEMAA